MKKMGYNRRSNKKIRMTEVKKRTNGKKRNLIVMRS